MKTTEAATAKLERSEAYEEPLPRSRYYRRGAPKRSEATNFNPPLMQSSFVNDSAGWAREEGDDSSESSTLTGQSSGACERYTAAKAAPSDGSPKRSRSPGPTVTHTENIVPSQPVTSGSTRKRCEVVGCMKYPRKGGKCAAHGGITRIIRCSVEGCQKYAVRRRLCKAHGANREPTPSAQQDAPHRSSTSIQSNIFHGVGIEGFYSYSAPHQLTDGRWMSSSDGKRRRRAEDGETSDWTSPASHSYNQHEDESDALQTYRYQYDIIPLPLASQSPLAQHSSAHRGRSQRIGNKTRERAASSYQDADGSLSPYAPDGGRKRESGAYAEEKSSDYHQASRYYGSYHDSNRQPEREDEFFPKYLVASERQAFAYPERHTAEDEGESDGNFSWSRALHQNCEALYSGESSNSNNAVRPQSRASSADRGRVHHDGDAADKDTGFSDRFSTRRRSNLHSRTSCTSPGCHLLAKVNGHCLHHSAATSAASSSAYVLQ